MFILQRSLYYIGGEDPSKVNRFKSPLFERSRSDLFLRCMAEESLDLLQGCQFGAKYYYLEASIWLQN